MKEGNKQQTHGRFAISPIAGNFLLEGPIQKNKMSFIVSGRRTWLDAITNLIGFANGGNRLGYNFNDVTVKINKILPHNQHLFLSFYRSKDRFKNSYTESNDRFVYGFDWGNTTLSGRYTRLFSENLFGSFQLGLVNYRYSLNTDSRTQEGRVQFDTRSSIRDVITKTDFDYSVTPSVRMRFGGQLNLRQFQPELRVFKGDFPDDDRANSATPTRSNEASVYAESQIDLSEQTTMNLGLVQSFNFVPNRTYSNLQPRFSIQYGLSDRMSIKAAYNTLVQYLHLLTNSSLGLPTDLWVPTNEAVRPQVSQQFSLGLYRSSTKGLSGSVEGYYKTLDNVLDYREAGSLFNEKASSWLDRVIVGSGRSYGVETYLKETLGTWSGWVSYTLSWNQRMFAALNSGQWFPYTYDRRHVLNAVVTKTTRPRQQLTANFIFNTGSAATLPTSRIQLPQPDPGISGLTQTNFNTSFNQIDILDYRNNFRLPSYHRLDVSYRFDKVKKAGTRSWILACYNIYNRRNPFIVYIQSGQLKQFTLFTIIPSATYSYAF
jgi:hypothetical protein